MDGLELLKVGDSLGFLTTERGTLTNYNHVLFNVDLVIKF